MYDPFYSANMHPVLTLSQPISIQDTRYWG